MKLGLNLIQLLEYIMLFTGVGAVLLFAVVYILIGISGKKDMSNKELIAIRKQLEAQDKNEDA